MDPLDLNGLRVFAVSAQTGSFTEAAEQLRLTPSAVSKAVRRLEASLGVRLFHRTTRSLCLTADGTDFLRCCQAVLLELEDAATALTHTRSEPKGKVRVLAPVGFGRHLLVRALPRFAELHPGIVLDLELSDRAADVIHEGLDLVVTTGVPRDAGLVARRLCSVQSLVCAAPSYLALHGEPKTPDDLDNHRCLGYVVPHTQDYRSWVFERDGQRLVKRPSGVLNINHAESVLRCAIAGGGLAMLSTYTTAEARRQGLLRVVMPDFRGVNPDFYLAYPPTRQLSARVRLFSEFVSNAVRSSPELIASIS